MGKPHAIVVPYPVQGHVIPHMELSRSLVKCGFKITFINTEFNHKRIMDTLQDDNEECQINMVSVPDGISAEKDRNDLGTFLYTIVCILPKEVGGVIKKINESENEDRIICIVSDMGCVLDAGDKMGIETIALWTMGAALQALMINIPKLIDNGVINPDGTLTEDQTIQLSPKMPVMKASEFVWLKIGDLRTQKIAFEHTVLNNAVMKDAKWHICNSSYELEPGTFAAIPNVLPIGPLLKSNGSKKSSDHFWPEDSTCLDWLNQHPAGSVVYVAFGSLTMFDCTQFQELALGLELSGQPFLWVVRPDMTHGSSDVYPEGFQARVATQGQMVGWAPQQMVLSHPSIACFVSHCGWNSTLESVSNGIPFLCWPYFADQFHNQSQICDVWKVGLRLNRNGHGIVSKIEIKDKVNELLKNDEIKLRISDLKENVQKSLSQEGSSTKNFYKFVNGILKH